jgi:hypothetical protein
MDEGKIKSIVLRRMYANAQSASMEQVTIAVHGGKASALQTAVKLRSRRPNETAKDNHA